MKHTINRLIALLVVSLVFVSSMPQAYAAPELLNRKFSVGQWTEEYSKVLISPDGSTSCI